MNNHEEFGTQNPEELRVAKRDMEKDCVDCPDTEKLEITVNDDLSILDDFSIKIEQEKKMCNWKKDNWNDENVYNTECNNSFYLSTDDTPEEHQFKYCPYCGGELKYAILLPDEIEKLMEEE